MLSMSVIVGMMALAIRSSSEVASDKAVGEGDTGCDSRPEVVMVEDAAVVVAVVAAS